MFPSAGEGIFGGALFARFDRNTGVPAPALEEGENPSTWRCLAAANFCRRGAAR
jgi:hypothetical protein